MKNSKCNGIRVSGYRKGYPCGAVAKYKGPDGKMYCHSHFAVISQEPNRMKLKK